MARAASNAARMPADVLLVSLGSTAGLRAADAELRGALRTGRRAGRRRPAASPREVRTLALTDLVWARAARAAAVRDRASTSRGRSCTRR